MKNNQPRNTGKQQRQATSSDYQQLLRFRALCCYVSDEDMTGFTLLYNTAWTLQFGQDPRQTARLRPDHLPDQDPARWRTSLQDNLQQPSSSLPRHLFFKLNAQILYLNLTHPTRKTTNHATPENNKGKRLPQITSNCWDFGPFAAMYPMKTWLALHYCTTRPGHYKVAKIRDRQPGCGQTICPTKTLPVWRTCFTRQLTTTLPCPPPPLYNKRLNPIVNCCTPNA